MASYISDNEAGPSIHRKHVVPVSTHRRIAGWQVHGRQFEALALGEHPGQTSVLEQLGIGSFASSCFLLLTFIEDGPFQRLRRHMNNEVEPSHLCVAELLRVRPAETSGPDGHSACRGQRK
jgi:hypothetical protein